MTNPLAILVQRVSAYWPRLPDFIQLMRLNRPIGIYLVLWPTLWGLWVAAGGVPPLSVLAIFVAGTVLMRAAGCVVNDFADREIDGHVWRTRERPLATGRIGEREALALAAGLALTAFALVLLTNWMTVLWSFGAVALAAAYPFMKRYTHLPQLVLGAAFAWAVPMGFTAVTGSVAPETWLLYIATVLWTVAYDTMYAMADRPDDLKIGVKSTAILFGDADKLMVGLLQGLTMLPLVLLGVRLGYGPAYFAGLTVACGFFTYQQYLIKDRDPGLSLKAFLNNSWVGLAVFAGLALNFALPG